jgi:hypothetical protein
MNLLKGIGSGLVAAGLIGLSFGMMNLTLNQETVFSGEIDGKQVVYKEGVPYGFPFNGINLVYNQLEITDGNTTYTLIDRTDETSFRSVGAVQPDYTEDRLEEIVVTTNSGSKTYSRKKIDDPSTNSSMARMLSMTFDSADIIYTAHRSVIHHRVLTQDKEDKEALENPFYPLERYLPSELKRY